MIAKDGLVSVHVASRSMSEPTVESEVESYRLEAYVSVRVFFSDSGDDIIVKLLKSKSVSYSRQ